MARFGATQEQTNRQQHGIVEGRLTLILADLNLNPRSPE